MAGTILAVRLVDVAADDVVRPSALDSGAAVPGANVLAGAVYVVVGKVAVALRRAVSDQNVAVERHALKDGLKLAFIAVKRPEGQVRHPWRAVQMDALEVVRLIAQVDDVIRFEEVAHARFGGLEHEIMVTGRDDDVLDALQETRPGDEPLFQPSHLLGRALVLARFGATPVRAQVVRADVARDDQ